MVFFQSQVGDGKPGGQRFCHIADMPGLIGDASDLLPVFRIPENKTVERSVLFQPPAFTGFGKLFGEFHMDGRTGNVQSKSALMLTCSWLCHKRASCKKLLLPPERAVSGNCPQIQATSVAGVKKLGGGSGGLTFQQSFRIAGSSFKWQTDINEMLRYKGFRQRMLPVDQTDVKISVHKKPPFLIHKLMKRKGGL